MSSVYLIRCDMTKAVKIGISEDPPKRLRQLQTGSPGRLAILGTIEGGEQKEAELHARFADKRLGGEWFNLNDDEIAAVLPRQATTSEIHQHWIDSGHNEPHLAYLASRLLGYPLTIAWLRLPGRKECYQAMRGDEGKGRGQKFWRWYVWVEPQYFDTPAEAVARFVDNWFTWLAEGNPND